MKLTTKEKIMSAALEHMALHGFKGTTTKCLAQLASVNEATIFKHFKGKDELIHETLEEQFVKLKTEIDTFFHSTHENIGELLLAKIEFINGIYERNKFFFMITTKELGSKELNFIDPSIFEYITQELEKELLTMADSSKSADEIRALSLIINSVIMVMLLEKIKDDIYGRPTSFEVKKELMVEMLVRIWGNY